MWNMINWQFSFNPENIIYGIGTVQVTRGCIISCWLLINLRKRPNCMLITFDANTGNSDRDGSTTPIHYAGDKLHNRDELQAAGASLELPHAILASHNKLGDKVFE